MHPADVEGVPCSNSSIGAVASSSTSLLAKLEEEEVNARQAVASAEPAQQAVLLNIWRTIRADLQRHRERMAEPGHAGPFAAAAHWEMLFCNGVLEPAMADFEHVPQLLHQKGISSPRQLFDMEDASVSSLLKCSSAAAAQVKRRCQRYCGTTTRSGILACALEAARFSIRTGSSSQQDAYKPHHPMSVTLWDCCEQDIRSYCASLPETPAVFPIEVVSADKGTAGEPMIQQAVNETIVRMVNRLLRYDAFLSAQPAYELRAQKRGTITDSQQKTMREAAASGRLAADNLSYQAASLALSSHSSNNDIMDIALSLVTGPCREEICMGELKRTERMMWFTSNAIDLACLEGNPLQLRADSTEVLQIVDAPCIPHIWNHPELLEQCRNTVALFKDVKGLMSQVARYAAPRGMKYALAGNYIYSWAVRMDGADFAVSRAFAHSAQEPTVVAMVYFICCKAIEHASSMEPWSTACSYNPPPVRDAEAGQGGGSSSGGGSSCDGSRSCTQGCTDQEGQLGAPSSNNCNSSRHTQQSTSHGPSVSGPDTQRIKAAFEAKSFVDTDLARVDDQYERQPQQELQQPSLSPPAVQHEQAEGTALLPSTAGGELKAAAALLDLQRVLGVIGVGASGLVFSYRLACGVLLALKIAPLGHLKAVALVREAAVMVALREHWGTYLPCLVAAGSECSGRSYVVATRYLTGRYLHPSTDQQLLPKLCRALAAVHACGVAHGDLRESNVLVQEDAAGEQHVWLIDWGNAVLHATQQDKDEDIWTLRSMFASGA